MRLLAYLMLLYGFYSLADAGWQEYRGVAKNSYEDDVTAYEPTISKTKSPGQYRNAMTYNWMMASGITGAGYFLLILVRNQERLDPLSPEFSGTKGLEELDEVMKQKELMKKKPRCEDKKNRLD